MAWSTGSITNASPAAAFSEILKAMVGGAGVANWSFVENIPAGLHTDEVQTITLTGWGAGDSFKLTYNGHESIAVNYASDVSADIRTALSSIPELSAHGMSYSYFFSVTRTSADVYYITFSGPQCTGKTMLPVTVTSAIGCSGSVAVTTAAVTRSGAAAYNVDVFKCSGTGTDANDAAKDFYIFFGRYDVNEIQRIVLSSWNATDTIKLTYNTHETAAITYSDDISADIVTALVALADFEPGDIACTKVDVNTYDVTFQGLKAYTDVLALTVTNGTGGATGAVTERLKGANSGTLMWVSCAEEYSNKMFKKAVFPTRSTTTFTTDSSGYLEYPATEYADTYYPANVMLANCSQFIPTLNTTGFTYQIKLTKDFLLLATRVSTTENHAYFGLIDSVVATDKSDIMPLLVLSTSTTPGNGSRGFSNLPGVLNFLPTAYLGGAYLDAWTNITAIGTNATNINDIWQVNRIPIYRGLVYHRVGSALYYLCGGVRGLLKEDVLCFYTGGTVQLGDTVAVNDDATPATYVVIGAAEGSHYLIVKAE